MPDRSLLNAALLKWYLLALVLVILDQLSKSMADSMLSYGQPVVILPVLNITLHYNNGAAFSFLSDAGGWQRWFFVAVSFLVSLGLMLWIALQRNQNTLLIVALVFVLGGAVGNLIDRLLLGYVIDFISLHWERYYFPTFNIADMAITCGAGLMLLDMVLHPEDK